MECQPTPVFLLGDSMDRGAWQATVHGVAESDTTEWLTYAHTAIKVTLLQAQWYYYLNFQMRNLKLRPSDFVQSPTANPGQHRNENPGLQIRCSVHNTSLCLAVLWGSQCLLLNRSPVLCTCGEGNSNLLLYSTLANPMDRGSWQATVHGVPKSRTQLKWLSMACTALHMAAT